MSWKGSHVTSTVAAPRRVALRMSAITVSVNVVSCLMSNRDRSVRRTGLPAVATAKRTESVAATLAVDAATIMVCPRAIGVTTPAPLTHAAAAARLTYVSAGDDVDRPY